MKRPRVSVIVPARNEEVLLPLCLASLAHQKTRTPFEVIVVDGNSTDRTPHIARKYGARYINETKRGKVFGFIRGAHVARGDILCFTEADCIVPPHWVDSVVRHFDRHPDSAGVSGWYTYTEAPAWKNTLVMLFHRVGNVLSHVIYGNATIRCSNSAVRTSAYKKIGGFNPQFLELYDTDIGKRLRKAGRIRHDHAITIQTSDRRIRGRFLRYLSELIPAGINVVLLERPLPQHTYKDIR